MAIFLNTPSLPPVLCCHRMAGTGRLRRRPATGMGCCLRPAVSVHDIVASDPIVELWNILLAHAVRGCTDAGRRARPAGERRRASPSAGAAAGSPSTRWTGRACTRSTSRKERLLQGQAGGAPPANGSDSVRSHDKEWKRRILEPKPPRVVTHIRGRGGVLDFFFQTGPYVLEILKFVESRTAVSSF